MRGDRTGNCGEGNLGYKKCEEEHVLCGRIQCTNIERIPLLSTNQAILQTPVGNILCWGIGFHKGLDVSDIGVTPDGSSCGAGKICINGSCVNIGIVNSNCDSSKCHNRGVCNNRRNCHCEYGWAPPFCRGKGYGGSIDSGPPPEYNPPANIIIGSTIGLLFILLILALIKKHILPSWLTREEAQEDSELDNTLQPVQEDSLEEEAPPLQDPTETTT
ncbi:disintegrin and metalloproteinase domain-containing protein 9-like [Sphaerodactylus townsendi]|uniref:disintegrin and metalloproteinase domain-containing protein 9-like n=1 Tax=Sphaerodactylus townsendi TaxID=933632 RepID=UPI002026F2EE|nr:disintegrin and metalloproteinase domain-containing protein 9-like [Sphaerodactylus townsendi]